MGIRIHRWPVCLLICCALLGGGCGYPFEPEEGNLFVRAGTETAEAVARVHLTLVDDGGAVMNGLQGTTAADGTVRLRGAPVGQWFLEITPPEGFALAPSQPASVPVRIKDDETTVVTLRLHRAAP